MTDLNYTSETGFTESELAQQNWKELSEYEERVPMTPAEKQALRKWVASGRSVQEYPESGYLCLYGSWPPPDFLSVYRMEQEIRENLRGKTKAEQRSWLMNYMGYEEERASEREERAARKQVPESVKAYIRRLERELFYLWMFLGREELCDDARSYVEEHREEPIPFEFE